MPANIGKMFYYGETPWHKSGVKLEQPANLSEALRYGYLNWEVELVDLVTIEGAQAPMRKAVVRREIQPNLFDRRDGKVIGVVHPGFQPLQNRQGAEVFDAIFGRGERVYHTGGYLGNGEVVWLLARLPETFTLAGNDIVEPYILYSNSHDGSRAIDFRLTTVRVVCQNTLNLALSSGDRNKVFKRSHSGRYGTLKDEFEGFFRFTIDALKVVQSQFGRLSQVLCEEEAFRQFVEAVFPLPAEPANQATAVKQAYETRKEQMEKLRKGVTNRWREANDHAPAAARGTWWGALNAVTAYVDHDMETQRDRYAFQMFGYGDVVKRKAYELSIQAAK